MEKKDVFLSMFLSKNLLIKLRLLTIYYLCILVSIKMQEKFFFKFSLCITKNREIENIQNSYDTSSAKSLFIKLLTSSARINFLFLYLKSYRVISTSLSIGQWRAFKRNFSLIFRQHWFKFDDGKYCCVDNVLLVLDLLFQRNIE